jgi:drug/metabolite transporter (DMT)-like permease
LFFGPALSFIFLEERISTNVIIGGAMVLVAAVLANWPRRTPLNQIDNNQPLLLQARVKNRYFKTR